MRPQHLRNTAHHSAGSAPSPAPTQPAPGADRAAASANEAGPETGGQGRAATLLAAPAHTGSNASPDADTQAVASIGPLRAPVSTLRRIATPLILTLVAVGILLYPVVITQLHNMEQKRVSAQFSQQVADTDPDQLAASIQAAHEYNKTLKTGPILDPWLARISEDNQDYQEYLAQLSVYDVMARLVVPSADIDLPVYHGTADDTLQKGVGHLYGTSLPVGGLGTHAVLTGHSGLSTASLFDNLRDVREGDPIYLAVGSEQLKYQVTSIDVVLPDQVDSLRPDAKLDQITLITCTPYGINTHRLLVHAQRVPMDPQTDTQAFDASALSWSWWMIALVAAAVALMAGMGWWVYRVHQATKQAGGGDRAGVAGRAEGVDRAEGARVSGAGSAEGVHRAEGPGAAGADRAEGADAAQSAGTTGAGKAGLVPADAQTTDHTDTTTGLRSVPSHRLETGNQ